MHYFLPVVAEVLDNPRDPDIDYLSCLLRRLRPLAELKLARLRHQANLPEQRIGVESVVVSRRSGESHRHRR